MIKTSLLVLIEKCIGNIDACFVWKNLTSLLLMSLFLKFSQSGPIILFECMQNHEAIVHLGIKYSEPLFIYLIGGFISLLNFYKA